MTVEVACSSLWWGCFGDSDRLIGDVNRIKGGHGWCSRRRKPETISSHLACLDEERSCLQGELGSPT